MREMFKRNGGEAFCYTYERTLKPNETVIVKMPSVSKMQRSVNDIGWMCDSDQLKLYGTLSAHYESESAMWQEITPGDEINKTVSALKIVNGGEICRINIRAILC